MKISKLLKKAALLPCLALSFQGVACAAGSNNVQVINIGSGNQVNTGVVVQDGNCKEGNGIIKTDTRSVASFSKVKIEGVFSVAMVSGTSQEVSMTADSNLLSLLTADIDNGTLIISTRASYCTTTGFQVNIAAPLIDGISVSGSSDIRAEFMTESPGLAVMLEGASSMQLSGRVASLNLVLHDTTEFSAEQGRVDTVKIQATDTAVARLPVLRSLTGKCTDVSEVSYLGTPAVLNVETEDIAEVGPAEE